jgi:prepilin peptidase CpaA
MQSTFFFLIVALAVTAIGAFYDLRSWRIPNWLSFGALAFGPVAHFALDTWTQGLQAGFMAAGGSILGGVLCGFVPWLGWRFGAFGGGDVKLLAAVGALCLPKLGVTIEFDAIIVGLVFAGARLAYEGRLFRTFGRSLLLVVNPLLPRARRIAIPEAVMTPMPFGPAIAGGVVVCALFQAA